MKKSETSKKSIIGAAQPLPDSNIDKASEKMNTTEGRKRIVNYVSQFLKDKHQKETNQVPENYDQIIDNVREFVGYLEGKNIINP